MAPLANLENATAKISAGRLDERVPLYGPRELRSLAEKVNAMASDLAESRQALLRAENIGDLRFVGSSFGPQYPQPDRGDPRHGADD